VIDGDGFGFGIATTLRVLEERLTRGERRGAR